jgi:C-terminal processing protease CtpA/Prc
MKRILILAVALLASGAAVAQTPAPDRLGAAYNNITRQLTGSWIGYTAGTSTPLNQPAGTLADENAVVNAISRNVSAMNDPRFHLLDAKEMGARQQQLMAGTVGLGAKLSTVQVVSEQGIEISKVYDNSYGAAAKVKTNDVIKQVNDRSVEGTPVSEIEALFGDRSAPPMKLLILRGKDLLTFIIHRDNDGKTGISWHAKNPVTKAFVESVDNNATATAAGLRAGDIIESIDALSTRTLPIEAVQSYITQGSYGTEMVFSITRAGTPMQLRVKREMMEGSAPQFKMQASGVKDNKQANDPRFNSCWLSVANISWATKAVWAGLDNTLMSFATCPGMILDLRNVSGDQADSAAQIAARFIKNGIVLQLTQASPNGPVDVVYTVENQGQSVRLTKTLTGGESRTEVIGDNIHTYDGQLAIITNASTSRVALALAQSLQANMRGRVVGKRTAEDATLEGLVSAHVSDQLTVAVELPSASMKRIDGSPLAAVTPDYDHEFNNDAPWSAFAVMNPLPADNSGAIVAFCVVALIVVVLLCVCCA